MSTITLKSLSLDKIIEEFSWCYQAYCNADAEDSSTALKYEFLKKKFSFDIVQKLKKEHRLKTEYLDFLINKYLKVLDTRWLKEWPWERVSQKLAEIGTNLEVVTFSDRPWEEVICYLPNLKRVFFRHHCTDEFLIHLSKFCGSVEVLDVRNSSRVSVSGLVNLCCIPGKSPPASHASIKELFIENTEVGDECVACILKNMPNLQKIDYKRLPEVLYSMHKSDINAFDKIKPYNLTYLNIKHTYYGDNIYDDYLKVCVSVCPHLKILSCLVFQKRDLDLCSHPQELEKLKLRCIRAELELNEILTQNCKNLTSLKIYRFCISLCVLAQNCPHLKSLMMVDVILQHNVNDSVPVFYNLEKVILEFFFMTEPALSQAVTCLLASSPNLNQLHFEFCDVVLSDIKTQILRCCEQCNLIIMDFRYSEMELAFLRDILLTCSTLKILRLDTSEMERNSEGMNELKKIATSLPNKPQICFPIEFHSRGYNVDEFMMNYYDDSFNT